MILKRNAWFVLVTMAACVFFLNGYLYLQSKLQHQKRALVPIRFFIDAVYRKYTTVIAKQGTSRYIGHEIPHTGRNITKNRIPKPLLTLFTTWNTNPEKYLVHNLTIKNWEKLKPFITPVVFTNESRIADAGRENGWDVLGIHEVSEDGVPVLRRMYIDTMKRYNSKFYAYCNSDILFTNSIIATLKWLSGTTSINSDIPVLVVGRRTDVEFVNEGEARSWSSIANVARRRGSLHWQFGADYFITTRSFPWSEIAPVIVGRAGYDNYLMFLSRKANYTVIDATETILALHQITESGNFESRRSSNAEYNVNLLRRLYKSRRFKKEGTSCIVNYTSFLDGRVVLLNRKMDAPCSR